MKVNQKLIAVLLALCTALSLVMPAAAADMTASYGEASYYDIAVTNYSRMAAFQNGVVAAADREAHYGLIDVTGKVVVPFQYKELEALGGGLFRAVKEDRKSVV